MPSTKYEVVNALPSSIFRTYDVRGIVNKTLTANGIFTLGLAIGSEAQKRQIHQLVVARDGRLSSPHFMQALQAGLSNSGCHVVDIGLVPTPVLYFAAQHLQLAGGVMLTGSHNPGHYNGLKIILGGSLTANEVLSLHQRILAQDFMAGQGHISHQTILQDYIHRIASDIKIVKPLRVVIDCGNGVAGRVAPQLFKALGCDVIPLFCEVDGHFPHHHPDPSVPDNLKAIITTVKQEKADIGLAFDGDADRLGVVTNQGEIIWPDRQMMLFSKDVLSRYPGADVVFDVKCSNYLPQVIRQYGGKPHWWKTGHSLIKHRMLELGAMLAGEMSGHIFFKERWYGFDDGLYAGARLLEILSQHDEDVSSLFHDFPNGLNTPEIKIPVNEKTKFTLIKRLIEKAQFPDAHLNTLDGLRIEFPYGWGLVRASNTTACLTLRFEADTQAQLDAIQDKMHQLLKTVGVEA